jgi:hypothetical protein
VSSFGYSGGSNPRNRRPLSCLSTRSSLARYSTQIRYWITLKETFQMKKLLVALIAAAFTAGAYAQAPKSDTAPATKAEKSDKKAQKKSTEKKSTKAKAKSKSDSKPAEKKQ